MSDELEHIDAIFSEKLKNYREKPHENSWDKLAMGLDQKNQQEKLNRNNKGKLGLLSITVISFMFIFSGHNIKTESSPQSKNHQPQLEKKSSSDIPLNPTLEITEMESEEEKPITKENPNEEEKTINSGNIINITQKDSQSTIEVIKETEKQEFQISSINIEKKPLVKILPPERETPKRSKGIKIEITLDTTGINKGAAAPQTKKTFNTLFKKLRKFTEASKKN